MSAQLPLSWPAPAHYRLDHFDGQGNQALLALLGRMAGPATDDVESAPLLIVGGSGSGKTHLLVATATAARDHGQHAGYLALSRWAAFDGDALAALASQQLLAVDEVEQIAGVREAEVALFDLYNRCLDSGCRLLLASREVPARLPLVLPDLGSRLAAATLMPLQPLPESARRELVGVRARARGFELEPAVIDFLFRHYRRDLPALLALIERLDRESLARKRRVTVPLVRAVLEQMP
ncbi:MAG: DnaA regulatory inactivator Hda [Xanthomonadales bacterium]|nr:DnaA regulatory inactivator Hda [Xanthomonadales bacterium]